VEEEESDDLDGNTSGAPASAAVAEVTKLLEDWL